MKKLFFLSQRINFPLDYKALNFLQLFFYFCCLNITICHIIGVENFKIICLNHITFVLFILSIIKCSFFGQEELPFLHVRMDVLMTLLSLKSNSLILIVRWLLFPLEIVTSFYQMITLCLTPHTLHSAIIGLTCTALQCVCGQHSIGRGLGFGGWDLPGAIPAITACFLQLKNLGKFNGRKSPQEFCV